MGKTSLAHGTILISISTIIFVFSGYLINIYLGRTLGPAEYGIYGIIITIMTNFNLTQTSGLPMSVAKFIADNENQADSVLKSGLIIQIGSTLLITIIVFFCSSQIANLLNDASLTPYIQLSSAVFPLYGIYIVYLNYYNGISLFRIHAVMGIIYSISKFILIIILVKYFNIYGAILGFVFSPLIALFYKFHLPDFKLKSYSYKKLILFSIPLIGLAIFATLLQSIDLLFVKSILKSNLVSGFYTASQNISKIPLYSMTALASVLFPSIAKSISLKDASRTKSIISKAFRYTLLVVLPSVLLISATSTKLLELLYSASYQQASTSLSILIFGMGFFTVFTIISSILSSSGSSYSVMFLTFIAVVINSILCVILIPLLGINGAAFSTTLSTLVIMSIGLFIVYRNFKIILPIKSLYKIILSCIIPYLIAFINIPVLLLPLFYILLFGVYILLLILLKEINKDDITLLRSLAPYWLKNKLIK
jgi:stage V sporulation protein B